MDRFWRQIHEFVAGIGESRDLGEFTARSLAGVGELIPFDANAMFLEADRAGRVVSWQTFADCSAWLGPFNDYYWQKMPALDKDMVAVDWHDYENDEYAVDFVLPQGMRYSLGLFHAPTGPDSGVVFALHRSAESRPFSETEQRMAGALRCHLFNLYRLFARLERVLPAVPDPLEVADRFKCLTHRETEVAALVCRRADTGAIASKLLISRLTVYKHIENIFGKLGINSRAELLERLGVRDPR